MAKKNTGYIKVSRDLLHSPIWESEERFTLRDIWIDLNLRANHSDQQKVQGNRSYTLRRGQLTGSLNQFAEWWHMGKIAARNKMLLLQELGLIYYDSKTLPQTLVTIVNYGVEQDGNGLGVNTNDTANDTANNTINDTTNDNENSTHYKNDKECNKNAERMNKKEPAAGDYFYEE